MNSDAVTKERGNCMKNDRKIKEEVKIITDLCNEFRSYPNPCAYTDSIIDRIFEHAEKLKKLSDSNG